MSAERARALVSEGATVPTAEQRARSECGKHKEVEREGNGRFSLSLCCQSRSKGRKRAFISFSLLSVNAQMFHHIHKLN